MSEKHKSMGFTLIEVTIALFIFAILGTMAAIGLRSVITTYRRVEAVNQRLQKLQLTVALMRRDISQIIDRPITDVNGATLPAFMVNKIDALEFTTQGAVLQRIGYTLEGDQWVRLTWPALDRSSHMKASRKILLTHITKVSLQFVSDQGKVVTAWEPHDNLPQAIIITLVFRDRAKLKSVFPLVGRGFYAS